MHMMMVMMTMMKVTIAACLRPFYCFSLVGRGRAYCLPVSDIFLFVQLYYLS